ncbi:MAG: aspartate/glutamate racemase family protein [Spirochaetota bacterium]
MRYAANAGQVSYGEAIGILLIENFVPFIPGDTANASTYTFPVRFQRIPDLTAKHLFEHDETMYTQVKEAAMQLKREGVRAVTGDCGFLAIYQKKLAEELKIPVFLSSLMQLGFIGQIISPNRPIGVITANSLALDASVLDGAGVDRATQRRLAIRGLESCGAFTEAVVEERGELDSEAIEACTVQTALDIQREREPGALLLECSLLPPYGAAVQEATGLPVFDYITMINYVYNAVVKHRYTGNM